MFARVEALAIRSFITDKINSLTTFITDKIERLIPFDYQRAWEKLKADLYKKQAHFLEDFEAMLADPNKINEALQSRQPLSSTKLNKKNGKIRPDNFKDVCVLDLTKDQKVFVEDSRLIGFMMDVFKEFESKDSQEFKEFDKAKSSSVEDQDPRRVAIILDAVCYHLESGYYEDNAKLIAKIYVTMPKPDQEPGVDSDRVFRPARERKLIKDKYPELRALAERALLTQRLKSDTIITESQRQSLPQKLFASLQAEVGNAASKVSNNKNKTKTTNPYGFFANKNYTSQQEILKKLQSASDVAEMGDIADKYKHLPYIACSPTMGPLLRSISHQAKQLKAKANTAPNPG